MANVVRCSIAEYVSIIECLPVGFFDCGKLSYPGEASMVSYAHGADESYTLNDELRFRERMGASAMAERYISQIIRTYFPDRSPSSIRVLDVGTGQGMAVKTLRTLGYDAYGLEPGGRFSDVDEDVRPYVYRVFSHDLEKTHPEVEKFDLLFSNGVVEHVGTTDGNADLVVDYIEYRSLFIKINTL